MQLFFYSFSAPRHPPFFSENFSFLFDVEGVIARTSSEQKERIISIELTSAHKSSTFLPALIYRITSINAMLFSLTFVHCPSILSAWRFTNDAVPHVWHSRSRIHFTYLVIFWSGVLYVAYDSFASPPPTIMKIRYQGVHSVFC